MAQDLNMPSLREHLHSFVQMFCLKEEIKNIQMGEILQKHHLNISFAIPISHVDGLVETQRLKWGQQFTQAALQNYRRWKVS